MILLKDLNVISKFVCLSENHKLTADCAHPAPRDNCCAKVYYCDWRFPNHRSKAAQVHTAQTAIKQVLEPGCLDPRSETSQDIRS